MKKIAILILAATGVALALSSCETSTSNTKADPYKFVPTHNVTKHNGVR